MSSDMIDKEVAELLPCICGYDVHQGECPRNYRPAVAAWAREREAILQAALATPQPGKEQNLYFQLQGAKAELAALRKENTRLKAPWLCDCHTWPGPDEAHTYIEALEKYVADAERERNTLKAKVDSLS